MPLIFSACPMNNEEWQLKQFYTDESMKKRTLSDMAIITMGQSPDSSSYNENGSGLPFFQGNAGFGDVHPHTQIFCSSPKKTAIPGDVLISVRAPIGAVNIADQKCCIGRGLAAITPLSDSNTGFIFYFLKSKTKILQSKGTGTTFKAIGKDILGKLSFPDYPLSQQKQIAMRLDKIQELVSLQKEQIRKLEQLVKSRFIEMFGDPITNTKGWKKRKLQETTWINPKKESDISENMIVSFVPMNAVSTSGEILYQEKGTVASLKKGFTFFAEGDILLAKITPCMENGKACIANNLHNRFGFGSTEFHVIRCDCKILNTKFLFFILHSKIFREIAAKFMNGSAGQKRLPVSYLEQYEVIIPPLSLQKQFAEFVEKTETQKALLEKRLNRLETLYKSLMQEYFG